MTVRQADIKGIKFLEEPDGAGKGGVAMVTFDLHGVAYTASADTVKIGTAGWENGVVNTSTLATIMQNRRRDGKTITITGCSAASVAPGYQAAATNGPLLYGRLLAVSGGDLQSMTIFDTPLTGGSECTCAASAWERPMSVIVTYKAV